MQNMGITRVGREILLKAKNAKVFPKGKIQNEVPFWKERVDRRTSGDS